MGQDKMLVGCGGLSGEPEVADRRVEEPASGLPPYVLPHSSKVFDEMHGNSGPPDDDREAQTATIARVAVAAHQQGDDDTVRAMGEALLHRIRGHHFTPEEKGFLVTVAKRRRARVNGTDVSKFMREIHGEAKRYIIAMIAANTPVTYEDAVRAVEP